MDARNAAFAVRATLTRLGDAHDCSHTRDFATVFTWHSCRVTMIDLAGQAGRSTTEMILQMHSKSPAMAEKYQRQRLAIPLAMVRELCDLHKTEQPPLPILDSQIEQDDGAGATSSTAEDDGFGPWRMVPTPTSSPEKQGVQGEEVPAPGCPRSPDAVTPRSSVASDVDDELCFYVVPQAVNGDQLTCHKLHVPSLRNSDRTACNTNNIPLRDMRPIGPVGEQAALCLRCLAARPDAWQYCAS